MKDNEDMRWERIKRVMKDFVPTPDVIESIIALNDGLYNRFRMVYEDLIEVEKMVHSDMESGRLKISGYEIFPEYFFAYDKEEGIPTADHEMLMDLSDETGYLMPSLTLYHDRWSVCRPKFEESSFCDDLGVSWNIENLNLPGLEDHQIHFFMHRLFCDANTFCPADIPFLKPKDLQWQITVQYEFFNK